MLRAATGDKESIPAIFIPPLRRGIAMRLFLPCLALLVCASSLIAASPAEEAWQSGQRAMQRDRFQEAMGHFRTALRLDPAFAQAHLSLAAAHLALGEEKQALPHPAAYLDA